MVGSLVGRTLLRVIGELLSRVPRPVQLRIGLFLGLLLGRLRWRHALVQSNLQLAFPGATTEAVSYRNCLARGFYRHFGNLVVELACQFGDWRNWVVRNCELSGLEHWEDAVARGRGVLFIASHLGNWEAMAASFSLAVERRPHSRGLLIVTKHLKPEWLHQAFERNRLKSRVRGTYEPRTMRDVLTELKKGGTVGFVLDQYAGPPIGVRVPFFGLPVGTLQAPAAIARRTGAAVLVAECRRNELGRLKVRIHPIQAWISAENPHRELAENTASWVSAIEASVRSEPEQWLWSHRRFKGDLSPLSPDEWTNPRERT